MLLKEINQGGKNQPNGFLHSFRKVQQFRLGLLQIKTRMGVLLESYLGDFNLLIWNLYKKDKPGSMRRRSADVKRSHNNFAKLRLLPKNNDLGCGAKLILVPHGIIEAINVERRELLPRKNVHLMATPVIQTCPFRQHDLIWTMATFLTVDFAYYSQILISLIEIKTA